MSNDELLVYEYEHRVFYSNIGVVQDDYQSVIGHLPLCEQYIVKADRSQMNIQTILLLLKAYELSGKSLFPCHNSAAPQKSNENQQQKPINLKGMIQVQYSRTAVGMGDEYMMGIYTITLPESATLSDLINTALDGGHGNDWPIAHVVGDPEWLIESDRGTLASVRATSRRIKYFFPKKMALNKLGVKEIIAFLQRK
ncbi:MAG: hypothetical protein Q4C54_04580 [Clostridia bacterium]|nr:hypothetical protein [Clostridia bacterium]